MKGGDTYKKQTELPIEDTVVTYNNHKTGELGYEFSKTLFSDIEASAYPFQSSRCRVERSLLWKITGSLAAAGNDLRVGIQLLFSKPKIIIKQIVFNRVHTKDPRPTNSIQR